MSIVRSTSQTFLSPIMYYSNGEILVNKLSIPEITFYKPGLAILLPLCYDFYMANQFSYFIDKIIEINQSEALDKKCMCLKKETESHLIGTRYPKEPLRFTMIKHPKNEILSVKTIDQDM